MTSQQEKMLKAAKLYAEKLGMSIIPVGKDKVPLVSWALYQKTKASSSQIEAWWAQYPDAMIGMVTGAISGLVVVDVDKPELALSKLENIGVSLNDGHPFTETPRGGFHIFFAHPGKIINNNANAVPGADFRGDGGYVVLPPSSNGSGKSYRWVNSILKGNLRYLPETYIEYCQKNNAYLNNTGDNNDDKSQQREWFTSGNRDEDLFHVANSLIRNRVPEKEVRTIIRQLAKSCDPPFSEAEADSKVNSALKRASARDRNISEDVRDWVKCMEGYFDVNDFYRDAGITNPIQKAAAITAFQRLVDGGVLEKQGERRGIYRLVENHCDAIDFVNAVDRSMPFTWPMGVEQWASIYPGNIAIIAGEKDAGKTAFMLNVVRMNMDRYPIHYFSSEMGAIEFKVRLSKFEGIGLKDWRFFPKERASKFDDVVVPDAINIIDFLEVYDEFYKMGLYIKQIFDKLTTGIAIIAIQKNKGTDYGLGGMRSIEKARLYLAIERGGLKIVSGKNWATECNPVGLVRNFTLARGCQFRPTNEWHREEEDEGA